MAIKRQGNWLGSMRVDVPHLRLLESSVAADFQALSGTMMTGSRALVAWGAALLGSVGQPTSGLYLRMGGAVLLHGTSAEPGSIFTVAAGTPDDQLVGTNPNVVGSFTPGAMNYVSVELVRAVDDTTAAPTVFRSSGTGLEFTQTVPLSRSLRYRIYISTNNFALTPTRAPVAKVDVSAFGVADAIEDCRQMYWRLGTGGNAPAPLAYYTWANRDEATASTLFEGGDKDIASQYDWNRAIMTRLWELGGGEHWYARTSDREVRLVCDAGSVFSGGENFDWNVGTSTVSWAGLSFVFANSTAQTNSVTNGSFVLADGECVYVDIDRATNAAVLAAQKAVAATLGSPTIPGSRYVLAWRVGAKLFTSTWSKEAGVLVPHASTFSFGTVKLLSSYLPDLPNPVVPVVDSNSYVVSRGITRDTPGVLVVGAGVTDEETHLSKPGAATTVRGALGVDELASFVNAYCEGLSVKWPSDGSAMSGTEAVYRSVNALHRSAGERNWYKGQVDTSVGSGTPNILTLAPVADGGTGGSVGFSKVDIVANTTALVEATIVMHPTSDDDNLDSLRYVEVRWYEADDLYAGPPPVAAGFFTLLKTTYHPCNDRKYQDADGTGATNDFKMTVSTFLDIDIVPKTIALVITVHNAFGPSLSGGFVNDGADLASQASMLYYGAGLPPEVVPVVPPPGALVITSPADNFAYTGQVDGVSVITVTGTLADAQSLTRQVELRRDGVKTGEFVSLAPGVTNWSINHLVNGAASSTHTIDAIASNSAGDGDVSNEDFTYTLAVPLTATLAPASMYKSGSSSIPVLISTSPSKCLTTPAGGVPGYTYLWEKVSGSVNINISTPNAIDTAFYATVSKTTTFVATFRCKVTDSVGTIAYTGNVVVTLQNTYEDPGP